MTTPSVKPGSRICALREQPRSELRALREWRGISEAKLAAQAGPAAPQVSQIESGRYIPSLKFISLLDALGAHLAIEANDRRSRKE